MFKNFSLSVLAMLTLAFTAESAFATVGIPATPMPLLVEQRLNDSALSAPIVKLGTQVTQKKVNVLKAVYDFAVLGGASGASIILKDASGGDATLPKNAIVKQVLVSVPTVLTGTATPSLAFGINSSANDLVSATLMSTLNTGERLTAGIPVGSAATMLRVRNYNHAVGMILSGAGAHLTAGKAVLYIEYYIGAPNE